MIEQLKRLDPTEKTIKHAGFGRRSILKKVIDNFKETELLPDEIYLGVVIPFRKPKEQLYVTDKRVIYIDSDIFEQKRKEFPIGVITSCTANKKVINGDLKIYSKNDTIEMKGIDTETLPNIQHIIKVLIN